MTVEMTEQEEREIRQYVASQTSDRENEVQLVQRVGRRRVAGYTHDLYDVWMSKGDRWWVITGMTNLYSQKEFHDLDQVFTFHLGLCALLREKFRIEAHEELAEHIGRAWRRYAKAVDAMSEAEEAEDFQAVGIRCREALLALIRDHAKAEWLAGPETPPKAADFEGWVELHAQAVASGRMRSYLRELGQEDLGPRGMAAALCRCNGTRRRDRPGSQRPLHSYVRSGRPPIPARVVTALPVL